MICPCAFITNFTHVQVSGKIDKEIVKHVHFGGFEDEDEAGDGDEVSSNITHARISLLNSIMQPTRKKSKAEVMAEVIAKSKMHKVSPSLKEWCAIN